MLPPFFWFFFCFFWFFDLILIFFLICVVFFWEVEGNYGTVVPKGMAPLCRIAAHPVLLSFFLVENCNALVAFLGP